MGQKAYPGIDLAKASSRVATADGSGLDFNIINSIKGVGLGIIAVFIAA